jgi:hypothetical protein
MLISPLIFFTVEMSSSPDGIGRLPSVQKGRGLILARTCRAEGTRFDPSTDVQKGRGMILAQTCRAEGTGFDPSTDVPCRRDGVRS